MIDIEAEMNARRLLSEFHSAARSRFDEAFDELSTRLAVNLWQNVFVAEAERYGTVFIDRLIERWPSDTMCLYFVKDILMSNWSMWTNCSENNVRAAIEHLSRELSTDWHTKYANQSALLEKCPWSSQLIDTWNWPIEIEIDPRTPIWMHDVQMVFDEFTRNVQKDLVAYSNSRFVTGSHLIGVVIRMLAPNAVIRYMVKQKQQYAFARLKTHKSQYVIFLQDAFKKRTDDITEKIRYFIRERCSLIVRELAKSFDQQNKLLDLLCGDKNKPIENVNMRHAEGTST